MILGTIKNSKESLINSRAMVTKERELYIGSEFPFCETVMPVSFEHGLGSIVQDVDRNSYIDMAFGLNVSCGHGHPRIIQAAQQAFSSIANAGNYTTPYRLRLCEQLTDFLEQKYGGMVFFSAGTEAVEAGTWFLRKISGAIELIAFHGSYHGKTLGSVSLACMKDWYGTRAANVTRVPFAHCYRCSYNMNVASCNFHCVNVIDDYIKQNTSRPVAGIIVEPVQGEAVVTPPPGFMGKLRDFCNDRGLLLMTDEVLTGIGRTGESIASFKEDVTPDVLAVGKCCGNGIPVSAVLVRNKHVQKVRHVLGSTTYGGNPLSMQIAAETLSIIKDERLVENARAIETLFQRYYAGIDSYPIVGDFRGTGAIWGIEFVSDKKTKKAAPDLCRAVAEEALRNGVLTYPIDQTLRLSPALNMDADEVKRACDIIRRSIEKVAKTAQHHSSGKGKGPRNE